MSRKRVELQLSCMMASVVSHWLSGTPINAGVSDAYDGTEHVGVDDIGVWTPYNSQHKDGCGYDMITQDNPKTLPSPPNPQPWRVHLHMLQVENSYFVKLLDINNLQQKLGCLYKFLARTATKQDNQCVYFVVL